MLNIKHTDSPDFYKYEDYLAEGGEVYIDPATVQRRLDYLISLNTTFLRNIMEYMWVNSGGEIKYFDKDSFLDFLEYHMRIKPYFLKDRKTGKRSVNKETVIKPIYEKYPHTQELLDMYIRHTEIKNDISKLQKILNEYIRETKYLGNEDQPLSAIPFGYERRITGRYYSHNDNIQGYSKRISDILTVPRDYFLYWSDFNQIDLRVAYETIIKEQDPSLDNIFQTTDDKYEAMARIMASKLNSEFNLQDFKGKRNLYKVGVLARTYGQSANQIANSTGDQKFAYTLDMYFKENKTYTRYLERLYELCHNASNFTITDYFGVEREITVTSDHSRVINQALNTPIQTTSNSIVMHYTNEVLDKFRSMGFGEDKIKLYLNRHDEVVWMIHKDLMPYLYIIEDLSSIQVDEWSLLTMDHHLGYNYGIEDAKLQEYFYQNVIDNKSQTTAQIKHPSRKDYIPAKALLPLTLYVQDSRILAVRKKFDGSLEIFHEKHLSSRPITPEQIVSVEKEISKEIIEMYKDTCQLYNFKTSVFDDAQYIPDGDCYATWSAEETGDVFRMRMDIARTFPETKEVI